MQDKFLILFFFMRDIPILFLRVCTGLSLKKYFSLSTNLSTNLSEHNLVQLFFGNTYKIKLFKQSRLRDMVILHGK